MIWNLAIKASLGDVWHANRGNDTARCDARIRLDKTQTVDDPHPQLLDVCAGYVCKRCRGMK